MGLGSCGRTTACIYVLFIISNMPSPGFKLKNVKFIGRVPILFEGIQEEQFMENVAVTLPNVKLLGNA